INGQGGGNRSHTVVAGNNILSPVMFGSCSVFTPVPVNVTFMLSMQGFTVSPNGVYIAGSFQGWNPSTSALTQDPQNPSVWSYTHNGLMSGDTIYYKFINGNSWGNDESVSGSCVFPGSTNRYLIVPLVNSTLGLVGFGSCSASNPIITFRVNMTGLTIDSAGVGIAGTLNGWNPASTRMTQDPTNPNIWTYSTPLATGTTVLYKFINGAAWGRDEILNDSTCGQPNGFGSYNRRYVVPALPATLPAVAFGSCNPPAPVLANLSGRYSYNNTANTPMTNSVVRLMSGTTVVATDSTDALGDYLITGVAPGSYTLSGVTSKPWGGVTASDALLATRHVVGALVQSGLRLKACDVNGSNTVTSGDALLINRRFSGGITSFNVGNFANSDPAVTVGSTNVTQNMQAICYGDINGSYSPSTATRLATVALTDGGWSYSRSMEITSDQVLELGSVSLVLNVPAGVEVVGVQSKLNGGNLDYQLVGNQLRLGWYHAEGFLAEAGQSLVELQIKANRDVKASEWTLGAETELTDVWAQAYAGTSLRIPSLKAGFSSLSVYPNPVVQNLGIRLPLQSASRLQVEILDAMGRVVLSQSFEATAGVFAKEVSVDGLAKGQYMLRVSEQGAEGTTLHSTRFVR
ncbi:MAG: T9SS type A sorting domain-containing protein, partial [Bacteroidota bacterium]